MPIYNYDHITPILYAALYSNQCRKKKKNAQDHHKSWKIASNHRRKPGRKSMHELTTNAASQSVKNLPRLVTAIYLAVLLVRSQVCLLLLHLRLCRLCSLDARKRSVFSQWKPLACTTVHDLTRNFELLAITSRLFRCQVRPCQTLGSCAHVSIFIHRRLAF